MRSSYSILSYIASETGMCKLKQELLISLFGTKKCLKFVAILSELTYFSSNARESITCKVQSSHKLCTMLPRYCSEHTELMKGLVSPIASQNCFPVLLLYKTSSDDSVMICKQYKLSPSKWSLSFQTSKQTNKQFYSSIHFL